MTKFLDSEGLSHFWAKIDALKQDALEAGDNIIIEGKKISATQPEVGDGVLTIKRNGENIATFSANSKDAQEADISVPESTSGLTNDSGFITKAVSDLENYYTKTDTYTKGEVASLIADIPKWTVSVVDKLPESGEERIIYLVPSEKADDGYDEYIWLQEESKWDKIGDTKIDLSNYYNKSEVEGFLAGKQDVLEAGDNVQIDGKKISATDTTYSAGNGLSLVGTEFSANTAILATKEDIANFESKTNKVIELKTGVTDDQYPSAKAVQTGLDGLNEDLSSAKTDISGLKKDLSTAQSDIGGLKTALSSAQTKLSGIAEGAEVNVQSDWKEVDDNSDAFIQNKRFYKRPRLPDRF